MFLCIYFCVKRVSIWMKQVKQISYCIHGKKWVKFILSLVETAKIKSYSYLSKITGKLLCNSHQRQKKMGMNWIKWMPYSDTLKWHFYRHRKVAPANGEMLEQSIKKKRGMFRALFNQLSKQKIFFRVILQISSGSGPFIVSKKGHSWGGDSVVPKCWGTAKVFSNCSAV